MFLTEDRKINKKYTCKNDTERCIYRFKNLEDETLYIGKSNNLKEDLNGSNKIYNDNYGDIFIVEYIEFDSDEDIEFAELYLISKYKPKLNKINSIKSLSLNIKELDEDKWNLYYINNHDELQLEINRVYKKIKTGFDKINAEDYIQIFYKNLATKQLNEIIDVEKYKEITNYKDELYKIKKVIIDKLNIEKEYKYIDIPESNIRIKGPKDIDLLKSILKTKNIGALIGVTAKSLALQKYCKTYGFMSSKNNNEIKYIRDYGKIKEGLIDMLNYDLYLDMKNIEKSK